jgi:Ni/Co efflux regulator RcnB
VGEYFMRKFVISAATICLIGSAGLAMAQDRDHGGGPHGGPDGAQHDSGSQPRPGPATLGPREHHDAPAMRAAPAATPSNAMRTNNDRRDNNAMRSPPSNNNASPNNAARGADNNAMRGPNNGPRPDFNRPGNGPNNAMRGSRRDFSTARNFHQNFRAPRRFHAPNYRRPPGWYSHRWGWGEILPVAFWSRNYWITNFYVYDLPPPPFGAIWVRVGDDALLIDQDSGEIIEVDYGVFY